MKFRPHPPEEPEINLIPFIDVLLVVLIFLMLSTTYSKFTELQLKLPVANGDAQRDYPREIIVAVASDGRYLVNKAPVTGIGVEASALMMSTVSALAWAARRAFATASTLRASSGCLLTA